MNEYNEFTTTIYKLNKRIEALEQMNPRLHSRYPYTFACDYLIEHFNIPNRSDASHKMGQIAEMLGESNSKKVCIAFAEAYISQNKGY